MSKWILPIIAAGMLAFATYSVVNARVPRPRLEPVIAPPVSPFESRVAAVGLIEPESEDIEIGTFLPGIVVEVGVVEGQQVSPGDLLFRIDDRDAVAAVAVAEARVFAAEQRLSELQSRPRAEDIPPAQARVLAAKAAVLEAEADLGNLRQQLAFAEQVSDRRAISQDELTRRRFAVESGEARVETAKARVAEAEAALALLNAGEFAPTVAVARAEVQSARADLAAAKVTLERLSVHAPVAGEVLQVNVRVGEYANTQVFSVSGDPLVVIGQTDTLHIRVDVDETEAWRVKPNARAIASLRGNAAITTPIQFVRREPQVVPKRSLTGDITERVDTRVLQLLYRLPKSDFPGVVGQQVDVFIEAEPLPGLTTAMVAEAN